MPEALDETAPTLVEDPLTRSGWGPIVRGIVARGRRDCGRRVRRFSRRMPERNIEDAKKARSRWIGRNSEGTEGLNKGRYCGDGPNASRDGI